MKLEELILKWDIDRTRQGVRCDIRAYWKNRESLPNMDQGVGSFNISKKLSIPRKEANRTFNKCFLIISRQIAVHQKLLTFITIKEFRRLLYGLCMRLRLLILEGFVLQREIYIERHPGLEQTWTDFVVVLDRDKQYILRMHMTSRGKTLCNWLQKSWEL